MSTNFPNLKGSSWAFLPHQMLSAYILFAQPALVIGVPGETPGGLCVCGLTWHIRKGCSLPLSLVMPFALRTSVPPAPPQAETQASLGSNCQVLDLLRDAPHLWISLSASQLSSYCYICGFLSPFWVIPVWMACLSFEFPFISGLHISDHRQVHSLGSIEQSFLLPWTLAKCWFIWESQAVKRKRTTARGGCNQMFNTLSFIHS